MPPPNTADFAEDKGYDLSNVCDLAVSLERVQTNFARYGWLDDRVAYAMGYNGLGVAMSSLLGKYAAQMVTGEKPDLGLITAKALRPIPFYPFREIGVRSVAGWYQFLDAIGR